MRHVVFLVVAAAALGAACSEKEAGAPPTMWTEAQAESIASVRGMAVHVLRCRGFAGVLKRDDALVYPRFRCFAGTRRPTDPIDTVGVRYVLTPLGPYRGPRASKYALSDVHFEGLMVP